MTTPAGDEGLIRTASNRIGRKVPHLVVRGLDERVVLAHAPSMACDRVHWHTIDDFDPRALLGDLGMPAWTRAWSDGQHRVWVPEGRGFEARERIKEWSAVRGLEPVNVRVEAKVRFRDLESIPDGLLPDLIAAALDWLYPRTYAIRRKIVATLDLVDEQDVRSMMYLFISDHADRYDADREGRNGTLNLLAFLFGKLCTWPQDAARAAYGRNVVGDGLTLNRIEDAVAAAEHRPATEIERAQALRTSVTDLRRREEAIATLSGLRNHRPLVSSAPEDGVHETLQVASDANVEDDAMAFQRKAALTRAVMAAVNRGGSKARRAQDPLALAAVYLTYWEELSRPEVARELEVLPKTVSSALARVHEQVHKSDVI